MVRLVCGSHTTADQLHEQAAAMAAVHARNAAAQARIATLGKVFINLSFIVLNNFFVAVVSYWIEAAASHHLENAVPASSGV